MAFEKPPSLENFQEIIPETKIELTLRQKTIRILAVICVLLLLLLVSVNLWKSDLTAQLRGTGAVHGVAVTTLGKPFEGSIFVTGTKLATKTNADGSFLLKNIPIGQRFIVIADSQSGREVPVNIVAGQVTEMGMVQFELTAAP